MKFFSGLGKPVELLYREAFLQRKGETLKGEMRVSIELNGNTVKSTPVFIRDEYETMKKATSHTKLVKIDMNIEDQSVEFYAHADAESSKQLIPYTCLQKLEIKKDKDANIQLFFTITDIELDRSNDEFFIYDIGRVAFAKFSETTPRLIEDEGDDEDEEDDVPEAQMEIEEEGPQPPKKAAKKKSAKKSAKKKKPPVH